jgi:hypothetical protein
MPIERVYRAARRGGGFGDGGVRAGSPTAKKRRPPPPPHAAPAGLPVVHAQAAAFPVPVPPQRPLPLVLRYGKVFNLTTTAATSNGGPEMSVSEDDSDYEDPSSMGSMDTFEADAADAMRRAMLHSGCPTPAGILSVLVPAPGAAPLVLLPPRPHLPPPGPAWQPPPGLARCTPTVPKPYI